METNKDIIIYMLLISDFFKRKSIDIKSAKLLLIEPIIVDIFNKTNKLSSNNILEKLKKLKLSDNKSQSIIDTFCSNRLLYTDDKSMTFLNVENVQIDELKNQIAISKNEKEEEWSDIKTTLILKINEYKCKHLSPSKLEKNILDFIYSLFEEIDLNKQNNKDKLLEIAIILESCGDNTENGNSCLQMFEDILLGVGIIQAIERDTKGFEGVTLPTIYLDNIFIGNLFDWCNPVQYASCKCIYDQLKTNGFTLKIHAETFDILSKSIIKYINKKFNKNRKADVSSFFYYMQYVDESKEFAFCMNNIEHQSITTKLKDKLDKLGIEIENSSLSIEVNKDDSLYKKIETDRKNIMLRRDGVISNLSSDQTEYDYKIIKQYSSIDNVAEDTISSIGEYFLTYQSPIYNNIIYTKNTRTYAPIMKVKNFATLLLLENIMSNIQDNSKLLEASIHTSYEGIMNEKTIDFFKNVHNDTNLEPSEKNELLVYASMPANTKSTFITDILTNDYETIKNNYRERDKKIEQMSSTIEEKDSIITNKNKKIKETSLELSNKNKKIISTQGKLIKATNTFKEKDEKIDTLEKQVENLKIKYRKIIVNVIAGVIFILCIIFREEIESHVNYSAVVISIIFALITVIYNLIDKQKK